LAVAFAQILLNGSSPLFCVEIRVTPQAQVQRIDLERDREFVLRAFERINTGRGAWTAHVARCSKIESRALVRVLRIGAFGASRTTPSRADGSPRIATWIASCVIASSVTPALAPNSIRWIMTGR
jgi:hypothetical protein